MSYFNKLFGKYKDEKDKFYYIFGHKFEISKNKLNKQELIYLLEKQKNEILLGVQRSINTAFLHQKTFSEFKNKFTGKTVVLVGAGPSLNDFKPIKNAIYVGVNRTFLKEDIKFDYLFANDAMGLNIKDKFLYDEFFNYNGNKCIKFIGDQNIGKDYQIPEGKLIENNIRRYKTTSNFTSDKFTLDIESEPLGNFASITLQAMQFILYTNPSKIYLVGIDNNLSSKGHFTEAKSSLEGGYTTIIQNEAKVLKAFKEIKEFAKTYYPDTEIISINPVGLKGIFKDEYNDKTIKTKAKKEKVKKNELEEFLDNINFKKRIEIINKKLKGKKVVIYGAGKLFESIYTNYDLKKLNIVGISDKCFKKKTSFLKIPVIPYNQLKNIKADYVLVCVRNYLKPIEELENVLPKNVKIRPLAKIDSIEKI